MLVVPEARLRHCRDIRQVGHALPGGDRECAQVARLQLLCRSLIVREDDTT
jgi:hypothetical protein